MYSLVHYTRKLSAACFAEEHVAQICSLKEKGFIVDLGGMTRSVSSPRPFTPTEMVEIDTFLQGKGLTCEKIFQNQQAKLVNCLERQRDDGVTLAMYELKNTFLRPQRYELEDAIQYVQNLTFETVKNLIPTQPMMKYYVGTAVAFQKDDEQTYPPHQSTKVSTKPTKLAVPHKVIPLQRNQVVLAFARRSVDLTDANEPIECLSGERSPSIDSLRSFVLIRKLLQTILFSSLGSRIYRIREETGLFYSATGRLHACRDLDFAGLDYILFRIEPQNVHIAISKVHEFFHLMSTNPKITTEELEGAQRNLEQDLALVFAKPNRLLEFAHALKDLFVDSQTELAKRMIEMSQAFTISEINAACKALFRVPFTYTVAVGRTTVEELVYSDL